MTDIVAFVLEEDRLRLLDQRALPENENWLDLYKHETIAVMIETLAVRGAPAIGGAAAAGIYVASVENEHADSAALYFALKEADARLRKTRPTAVNLFYALDRMAEARERLLKENASVPESQAALYREAHAIISEDAASCLAMGKHGAPLFEDGDKVLTICHTGALATCGQGTALGVLKSAKAQGKNIEVFALETRPLLQGSRLTAWECLKSGLDVTLITDNMVGITLERKGITKAIAGADRIARNGDSANKIGTYNLSALCELHQVPFYIAAPVSTVDATLKEGSEIPIEERHPDEVRRFKGAVSAPMNVKVYNPAFDVTPAKRIDKIITDKGLWDPKKTAFPFV